MTRIDPAARVSTGCELGPDVVVGPFAVIETGTRLGAGTIIGGHAVVKTGALLGERVRVAEGAVIGGEPQDLKFNGSPSFVEIGADSVIREFATVHRSAAEGGSTRLGERCFVMAYGHVAHDCELEDGVIIAGATALAGHVRIGPRAFVSGGVVIHQFCRIGELAMIGGGAKITLDVPPFFTVDGNPGRAVGLNRVGLQRAAIGPEAVRSLKAAYRLLYRSKLPLAEALERIDALSTPEALRLAAFIKASERGICRERRGAR